MKIRNDNGTEFKYCDLFKFCDQNDISLEFSTAKVPQQNGIV